ncbi:MAG: hypothetical protein WBP81_32535 [Solirubrobacteraceae bacterium]
MSRALAVAPNDTFGAYLNTIRPRKAAALGLGKTIETMLSEAEHRHKQLDSLRIRPPDLPFSGSNTNQARDSNSWQDE